MFHAPDLKRKSRDGEENTLSRKRPSLGSTQYWMVLWRVSNAARKNNPWHGDGVLKIEGNACWLQDTDGTDLARAKTHETTFEEGNEFCIGSKDVQLDRKISEKEYLSGACFGVMAAFEPSVPPQKAPLMQTSYANSKKPASSIKFHPPTLKPAEQASTSSLAKNSGLKSKQKPERESSYWTVQWRKPQTKTNKSWDGDGFVVLEDGQLTLFSETNRTLGSSPWGSKSLEPGKLLHIGSKEVQLDNEISNEAFKSGRIDPEVMGESSSITTLNLSAFSAPVKKQTITSNSNFYTSAKNPIQPAGKPRHDPTAEGAIVMKPPDAEHQALHNKKNLPVVPIVIDPLLARHLRPHQVEGVKFLYQSVMGMRKHEGNGCILADEMGLGKTLQTITLVWTLLKQNPYGNCNGVIGKAMVVCPVSLVNNWRKEFNKWVGRDRIGVFVGDTDKTKIKQFVNSKIHQVLIIGYERLRSVIADLAYCNPPIGLIICDEGHRLKSANNKTSKMFDALRTKRRVILSGTPIQNDLGEFHAMADFCNPGLLDDYKTFNRIFEAPILKSREPNCTAKNLEVGKARSEQLLEISRSFVLRRTADILSNYLPSKTEYVVFVKPTSLQLSVFKTILSSKIVDDVIHGPMAKSLALINTLTKVCNSPMLLKKTDPAKAASAIPSNVQSAIDLLPSNTKPSDFSLSGKLIFLGRLLASLRKQTEEKCVLVSHYTSTLNILEDYCKTQKYTYFRLDGSTNVQKRQEYVDDFNRCTQKNGFLFLLSAKAGGTGLNLIGASRLVLIDSDWNPSHDLQAMARIHRDGQKRPVFIYRLLTAGTIDEKIFQRQMTKIGLSESLMGPETSEGDKSSKDEFSASQLKDLFTVNPHAKCTTHELSGCRCQDRVTGHVALNRAGSVSSSSDVEIVEDNSSSDEDSQTGFVAASQWQTKLNKSSDKKGAKHLAALQDWSHIDCLKRSASDLIADPMLQHLLTKQGSSKEEAIDMEDDFDEDDSMSEDNNREIDSVGDGAMTFVFERKSK